MSYVANKKTEISLCDIQHTALTIYYIRMTIYELQAYRYDFRYSLILHGHAIDRVGAFHGDAVVGDKDDLGLSADVLNDLHEAHEVCIVQRCIDFIHQ